MTYLSLLRIVSEQDIWILLLIIPALYFLYLFYFGITYKMAKKRHRDPLGWVILSFFITPIWVWIILLIAGDKGE